MDKELNGDWNDSNRQARIKMMVASIILEDSGQGLVIKDDPVYYVIRLDEKFSFPSIREEVRVAVQSIEDDQVERAYNLQTESLF